MNALFRHIKAFALLLSFALIFVNTVGAVGMVSMQHGAPGPDSSHGMHASMSDHGSDAAHIHGNVHAAHTETNPDCMDDSTCASTCAAHCATIVFYQSPPLTAPTLVTKTASIPSFAPPAAMVSGLYKPPRPLH